MENRTILSRGLLAVLALGLVACAGSSPTGPTKATLEPGPAAARPSGQDLDGLSTDVGAPDASVFASAFDRLRNGRRARVAADVGDASSFSIDADWFLTVLRAPRTGTTMKVLSSGFSPQPAPKFKFKLQAPMNIPESAILVIFLTAGGKECGLATTRNPFSLQAEKPRNVDIANDYIVVGPEACFLDGQNCTRTQCKFPLTTTKMRILFGNDDQGVADGKVTVKYKWVPR